MRDECALASAAPGVIAGEMSDLELTLSDRLRQAQTARQAGKLAEAAQLYRAILDRDGDNPVALHLLGVIEFQQGNASNAARLIDKALALRPDYVEAWMDRGNTLCASDQPQQALPYYDQALLIAPDHAGALYNRGYALQLLHRPEEALANYDQALAANPNQAEILNNRGNVLGTLKRWHAALTSFDRALSIRPHFAAALSNRGNPLAELGRFPEALESYEQALTIDPNYADALYGRGNVLREMNCWQAAIESYTRALAIKPDHIAAKFALCIAELPILYSDEPEIALRRAAFEQRLRALCDEFDGDGTSAKWADGVADTPFYLAYQGYNDRDLQAQFGALVSRIMRARYGPAQLPSPPQPSEPVRVGFVGGHFRRHSASTLQLRGWITQLDRRQFRICGYHTGFEEDDETKFYAASCDRFVRGPMLLDDWRETILADAPHVVIYPETMMDATAVALAAQRLARVQCSGWGHPGTSGLPTIDYFLGGDLMEPIDGQDHYSERLVRLPNLGGYVEPIDLPAASVGRDELGLRPGATVYWCGQSVFKYLPQFDRVFTGIASVVDNCQFVFFEHQKAAQVTELFRMRLERAFALFGMRAADYCVFLPRMPFAKFSAIFDQCDVVLDSIGFTGCNTTIASLSHRLPIVTVAGPLMRGRQTQGILKMMGVTETVAETVDEYVAIAIRLAQDLRWRMAIRARMAEHSHEIYRDRSCIVALEEFLNRVAREG